jgi:signal peptidase II
MSFEKYSKLLIISAVIIALDQITKAIILKHLGLYHSIKIIPGFFSITHIHNPGGAFGFLANQSTAVRVVVFLFVSILALGFIFYFYQKTPPTHKMLATGFALIFGGAIGNLIDRVRFGTVVDFLDVYIKDLHWPAFNIADSAITIGMGVFVYHILAKKMPE